MISKDNFMKLAFAIEMALLPIVICCNLYFSKTVVGIIVCAVALMFAVREILKNRFDFKSILLGDIATSITISVLLIFLMAIGLMDIAIGVVAVVMTILMNTLHICLCKKGMADFVESVDFCFTLFAFLQVVATALTLFLPTFFKPSLVLVGAFAIIFTTLISVGYKVYYSFKYLNIWSKIKSVFSKK